MITTHPFTNLDVPAVGVDDVARDGGAVGRAGGVDGDGQPRHHDLPAGVPHVRLGPDSKENYLA